MRNLLINALEFVPGSRRASRKGSRRAEEKGGGTGERKWHGGEEAPSTAGRGGGEMERALASDLIEFQDLDNAKKVFS